jgi:DNA-binding NtrC family response regulator
MGGVDTYTELRRIAADVRVVVSSGYAEQDAMSRFSGKHTYGFVRKPYVPTELIGAVRRALEGERG